jgi:hypothetical protein
MSVGRPSIPLVEKNVYLTTGMIFLSAGLKTNLIVLVVMVGRVSARYYKGLYFFLGYSLRHLQRILRWLKASHVQESRHISPILFVEIDGTKIDSIDVNEPQCLFSRLNCSVTRKFYESQIEHLRNY